MTIGIYSPNGCLPSAERMSAIAGEAERLGRRVIFFDAAQWDDGSCTVLGTVFADGGWKRRRVPLPPAVVIGTGAFGTGGFGAGEICTGADPAASLPSDGEQWLRRHAVCIAADMPEDHEHLCRRLRQDARLRTLVDEEFAEGADDPPVQAHCFRIRLSRSAPDAWSAGDIELPGSEAELAAGDAATVACPNTTGNVRTWLAAQFPHAHMFVEAYLRQLAGDLAAALERAYAVKLPSLVVDVAIDSRQYRTRLLGADIGSGPAEAMPGAMAYAASVLSERRQQRVPAQRGPVYDGPFAGYTVGMMVGKPHPTSLYLDACRDVVQSNGSRFFYFSPEQVDVEKQEITGTHWRDGKWRQAKFAYPDVVYDRLKRIGEKHAPLYASLSAVPMTHRLAYDAFDKIGVYRAVSSHPDVAHAVIPFQVLDRSPQCAEFMERYPKFVIKPARGLNGKHILLVTRTGDRFEVFDQTFVHDMSGDQFRKLLRELRKYNYFMQKFVDSATKEGFPFHFRVHLMKNGSGKWRIVFIFPSISLIPTMKITNHKGTFRTVTKWEWFLDKQFGETLNGPLDRRIKTFSYNMAHFLHEWFGGGFHEVGLDLGIEADGAVQLFEANLNNIGTNFHPFEAAKYGMEYALFLAAAADKR